MNKYVPSDDQKQFGKQVAEAMYRRYNKNVFLGHDTCMALRAMIEYKMAKEGWEKKKNLEETT
jgi:hypothetical protein